MPDRRQRLLNISVIGLSAMAIAFAFERLSTVDAQSIKPLQHCVWSYISDSGHPNIGEDGAVENKDKNWQRMSDEGWQLKATKADDYIFERCE